MISSHQHRWRIRLELKGAFTKSKPLGIGDCLLVDFPHTKDMQGTVTPIAFTKDLPFLPTRSFFRV